MPTYVMLTRVSGDALKDLTTLEELGRRVTEKLNTRLPRREVAGQLCGARRLRLRRRVRGA
jgi:hypothetical protein